MGSPSFNEALSILSTSDEPLINNQDHRELRGDLADVLVRAGKSIYPSDNPNDPANDAAKRLNEALRDVADKIRAGAFFNQELIMVNMQEPSGQIVQTFQWSYFYHKVIRIIKALTNQEIEKTAPITVN